MELLPKCNEWAAQYDKKKSVIFLGGLWIFTYEIFHVLKIIMSIFYKYLKAFMW